MEVLYKWQDSDHIYKRCGHYVDHLAWFEKYSKDGVYLGDVLISDQGVIQPRAKK